MATLTSVEVEQLVKEIAALIKSSGGFYKFNLPADQRFLTAYGELEFKKVLNKMGFMPYSENNNIIGYMARGAVVNNGVKEIPMKHTYILPDFHELVMAQFFCATDYANFKSSNVQFVGPAGCGKSEYAVIIAAKAGFSGIFEVSGGSSAGVENFYGAKTVVVDPKSQQSYIKFDKGPLYKALIEGTETDADGNQILYNEAGERVFDGSGNPKINGKPGLFFLDDWTALTNHIATEVLNPLLEIPRQAGLCRTVNVPGDRLVKSHPGFAVILAGNTLGKGLETEEQQGYTSQNFQQDDSTQSRINITFKFGYNVTAEKAIIKSKFGTVENADKMIRFVQAIRRGWKEGRENCETLISTRHIVSISDLAYVFNKAGKGNYVELALRYGIFSKLREQEQSYWNETIRAIFSLNLKTPLVSDKCEMFYADRAVNI